MEPCLFSCPDGAWLHDADCVLSRHLKMWDAVDAVALRVLGSPFIRPARLVEHAIFSPDLIGPWVLVEMHERYRVPFVYFQEAT